MDYPDGPNVTIVSLEVEEWGKERIEEMTSLDVYSFEDGGMGPLVKSMRGWSLEAGKGKKKDSTLEPPKGMKTCWLANILIGT